MQYSCRAMSLTKSILHTNGQMRKQSVWLTFLHLYFRQQSGDAASSEVFHVFAHRFPSGWAQYFVHLRLAVKPDFKDQIKRWRRAVRQRAAFGNLDTGCAFGGDHQRCVRLEIVFIELLRVLRRAVQTLRLKPPLLLAEALVVVPTAARASADEMNAMRRSMAGSFE